MNFLSCFKSFQNEYLNTFTKIYDHDTRLAYIEKQLIPPGYFVLNSERGFAPHFYHRVTDSWQYEPGRQK